MAENAHEVPQKYGKITKIYHPRVTSYHRRLLAVVPHALLAIACTWFLFAKRPTPIFTVVLVLVALSALCALYSVLKPHIVVTTQTHILRGRLFGWQAVELASIDHTVLAERLTPKQAAGKELSGLAALRHKGVPAMWAVNAHKKRVFRLDGRIWDAKTLRAIATAIAPQTTVYPSINVTQMSKQWPGLVTFNELHPGWKSNTLGAIAALFLIALALAAVLPEETLRQWNLL